MRRARKGQRHFRVRFFRPPHDGARPTWTQWHAGVLTPARYEHMYDRLVKRGERFECEMVKPPVKKRHEVLEP